MKFKKTPEERIEDVLTSLVAPDLLEETVKAVMKIVDELTQESYDEGFAANNEP